MHEHQNIEWKESWRDEYLKWICGFANAQGGVLVIGKNDKGKVIGIENAKKLMEDIPNKVRDILGIFVEVNLKFEKDKESLEIRVEQYPFPVNYKGQYFYRSGSTNQELKGATLDKFLLRKHGKRWDSIPVPNVVFSDLEAQTFDKFKRMASKSGRISDEAISESNEILIENLNLKEGEYIKRAAVMLFHNDPERFVTGAFIKIGFFKTETELIYQDVVTGNLFEQADKTLDLLLTKYLRANISYEGINRVEIYPYPKAALREALLNAIVHKDYSSGIPIQIKVYENRIVFWNDGKLPENWTIEQLQREHPSNPFNPDIANAFFRAGLIESWGRGIKKITDECRIAGLPVPEIRYEFGGLLVEFRIKIQDVSEKTSGKNVGEKRRGKTSGKIIELIKSNTQITIPEIAVIVGVTERSIERNIQKLQKENILERVGPAKGGFWKVSLDNTGEHNEQ